VYSRAGDGGVLRAKRSRSRVKRSSGVEGEAVRATVCYGGEAVKGTLRRRRRAPGVGGDVEDLNRVSGKILLSVEQATRSPDIYIGSQMLNTCLVRRVAHFFRHVAHYF
jgi:hypothetical protein